MWEVPVSNTAIAGATNYLRIPFHLQIWAKCSMLTFIPGTQPYHQVGLQCACGMLHFTLAYTHSQLFNNIVKPFIQESK